MSSHRRWELPGTREPRNTSDLAGERNQHSTVSHWLVKCDTQVLWCYVSMVLRLYVSMVASPNCSRAWQISAIIIEYALM